MSRKGSSQRRDIIPDPKYNDKIVASLVTKIMCDGKKSVAEKVVYRALHIVSEKTKGDPLKIFRETVAALKPMLEVRSRRVGGATYQVPTEVRPERQLTLALRWLVANAEQRGGRTMEEKLAGEILDAHEGRGGAIRKREDVHKMAEANRAFAHYRW